MNKFTLSFTLIILAIIIICVGLGYFIERSDQKLERKLEYYQESKKLKDSLIKIQEKEIQSLRTERDGYIIQIDSIHRDLDSLIEYSIQLTDTRVSKKNKQEALKWIKKYNSSL